MCETSPVRQPPGSVGNISKRLTMISTSPANMQQVPAHQEERYADGLDEYASFYGGPSYHYLAPAKPPPLPRGSTISQPSTLEPDRHSATSNLQHAISYDLAANVPEFRRDAEGLQLAYQSPITGAPVPYHLTAQSYTREAEGLQFSQQRQIYHYQTNVAQPNMFTPRNSSLKSGNPVPAAAPTPLHFRRRSSVTEPNLHHFPQPPTSPTSSASPTSPTTLKLLHPLAQKPIPQQPLPQVPAAPQPLKFQRSNTAPMPPTPPRSVGGRSNEDALREQMLGLKLGDPSPILGKYVSGPPRFPLGRMDTVSSMSSARSSNTPGSPFDQQHRISVTQGNPTPSLPGVIEQGPPGMSAADAQAEVLRLLDKADETSSKKSGAPVKKGFSLKRSNTTKPASNASHSQDALTSVLENVAEEGSLPMVKAVIGLGADPVYRSSGKLKKVKHEALSKATAAGRADVVDFLLQKGASYGEASKKGTFTPLDRALLTAVYGGHAELARILIMNHGANPMVEQWPREMDDTQHYWAQNQVRLSKTSVLDGLSHWKNEDQGMNVLRAAMISSKFDPTASASGVFDNKSELQSGEFANRPWNTTYEYSAIACFARAGWADAVEELLSKKGSPKDYEKEDEVLQYQDKVTRWISPINALTKDTWEQRPESALRILRALIDRGFNLSLPQRTANDLGQRTALGRALSANASQAVELITQARPELVKEVISFRRNKKETKAQPLAAAICLERLDTARVLFRMGAHPRDPAFDMNALQFCAHQGGETGAVMLAEMIGLAPELTYAALDVAVRRINADCVRVLLDSISAAAARNEVAALPAIWDMLLPIPTSTIEESPTSKSSYLALIDMVFTWDAGRALPAPQLPAILAAIKRDNYVGMEKFLKLGIVDGKNLVLNCKAQPMGEQGLWTVLECAEGTQRSSEWLGLLRGWGAPLYT